MTDFDMQLEPKRRTATSRAPVIVALIAMLCIGVLAGVVLEHTVFHPLWRGHGGRGWDGAPPRGEAMRGEGSRRMGDRLARELALTPAQRTQVDSITAQSMRRVEQVRQQIRPQMRQIFEETHARIDAVLTPAQRERLRALFPRPKWTGAHAGDGGHR